MSGSGNPQLVTPQQFAVRLAEGLSVTPKTYGPCRAFQAACRVQQMDPGDCALALVELGISKLGNHDLAVLPNDQPWIAAIRANDEAARVHLKGLARHYTWSGIAASLRVNMIWVWAACARWAVYVHERPTAPRPIENEQRLVESMPPVQLSGYLRKVLSGYRQWPREAAWSIGVGPKWFSYKLRTLPVPLLDRSMASPEHKAAPAQPMLDYRSGSEEEKAKIRARIVKLGSIAAWAEDVGITLGQAKRQAAAAGYQPGARRGPGQARVSRKALERWIKETKYTGATQGVGSGWLCRNVIGLRSPAGADSRSVARIMRSLGFVSMDRTRCSDKVWVLPHIDVTAEQFKKTTPDRLPGPLDVGKRRALRQAILDGTIANPTADQLDMAGLHLEKSG